MFAVGPVHQIDQFGRDYPFDRDVLADGVALDPIGDLALCRLIRAIAFIIGACTVFVDPNSSASMIWTSPVR
ncbi:hypothetical protein [Nocardia sp. NPDC047038]|uniref:hypothetical protein n=1 Tax=Nocardia sp. NPDC047038 TaxID=3154338 RepID=UPI0033CEDD75